MRVCVYCGQCAPDPAAEPICSGRGGVDSHRYRDLPLLCECPSCGWDDSGDLVLRDWYAEERPPIPPPRNPVSRLEVAGDPEAGRRLACPRCDTDLSPDAVRPRVRDYLKRCPRCGDSVHVSQLVAGAGCRGCLEHA